MGKAGETVDNQEKYRTNEMKLQAYRLMFIPLEAILIVAGIAVYEKPRFLFLFLMAVSLYTIWGLWFPIVRARQKVVDYYKYQSTPDQVRDLGVDLESYIHDKELRRKVNDQLGISANWRTTRRKIDFILPVLFTLIWFVLLIYIV
jgi:hypothetical protein